MSSDKDDQWNKDMDAKIREIFGDESSKSDSGTWNKFKSKIIKIFEPKGSNKIEKKASGGMVRKSKVAGRLATRGYGKAMKGKK